MLEFVLENQASYIGGILQMVHQELGYNDVVAEYVGEITDMFEKNKLLWVCLKDVKKRYIRHSLPTTHEWFEHAPYEHYPIDIHVANSDALHMGAGIYRFRADNQGHAAVGTMYPSGLPIKEIDMNNPFAFV